MQNPCYLVAGLGKTGCSIARYLQRRGHTFIAFDTRESPTQADEFQSQFPQVEVYLGTLPETVIARVVEVIASPGVSLQHPVMRRLRELGISVIGDIECFSRENTKPVLAITGTNGKSTVTTLVHEMAKEEGLSVAMAGNIGTPVLDRLDDGVDYDLWVLELSSFQLELTFSLHAFAATILNVTPDHLDRHETMRAYVQAKQRIYHQAPFVIYDRKDAHTTPEFLSPSSRAISFGLDEPEEGQWGIRMIDHKPYMMQGSQVLFDLGEMHLKGMHNWLNALAACALASCAHIKPVSMINVLRRFPGLTHRTQWIRTLDGVDWINDSKGTNLGATCSALNGIGPVMTGKIVLIAGGQGKGAAFDALREPVSQYVRCVILLGEDAFMIHNALKNVLMRHTTDVNADHRVELVQVNSVEEAVAQAQQRACAGDVVLLSPACASLDMFRDFNHRGDVFVAAVAAL